jgi:hypothetical protein
MTSQLHDLRDLKFDEGVRVPGWVIGILGLVLGVTAGALTGVAIRNLIGDEPLISGAEAAIFYVTFALAVLLDVFILFNFTNLTLSVSESGFECRYGLFGKSFKWEQINSAEVSDYRWITYGGWGIRYSTKGRRAWSQLGAKQGVVLNVTEGSSERHYFVSSKRPDELLDALNRGIGPKDSSAADENEAPESGIGTA